MRQAAIALVAYWIVVGLAFVLNISFAGLWLDALILLVGYVGFGLLCVCLLLRGKPGFFGIASASLATIALVLFVCVASVVFALDPWLRPDAVIAQQGLECRAIYTGSDSGVSIEVRIFRELAFGLEYRMSDQILEDHLSGESELQGCPPVLVTTRPPLEKSGDKSNMLIVQ